MIQEIIRSKNDLKDWLRYERGKYGKVNAFLLLFQASERAVLWKHQILLRKTEYYTNVGKGLLSNLYKFRLNKMQNKYSLHIPINTCGRGLKVMHLGPILINGMVRIGRDCSIHINTALVAGGGDDGVPTLGNGCVICVGAVICGAIQVADDVVIGANAVVNRDVMESDITVAGVPARKISENGRTSWGRCCVYSK